MKKILIVALTFIISLSAFSQEYKQALGIRLGYDMSITYKNNLSDKNFIDASVNFGLFHPGLFSLVVSGFYDWRWDIPNVKGLSWYVGPGIFLGPMFYSYAGEGGGSKMSFLLSINAGIGLEYKFANTPIALSLDYYPGLQITPGVGFAYANGGLGVKYTF